MRKACAAAAKDMPGFALPAIVTTGGLMLLGHPGTLTTQTARAGAFLLDLWMLLVLLVTFSIWSVLRPRFGFDRAAETGFTLAAFGLASRVYLDFLLYVYAASGGAVFGGKSVMEELLADERGGTLLVMTHRWGGLAAYLLGFAFVAWASRPRRYRFLG